MSLRLLSFKTACLALGLALTANTAASAADPVQQHNSNAVWFENWVGLSNASLVVAAPDGTITTIQATSGTPVFQLDPGKVVDGIYRYELRAATEATVKIVNPVDNGRGDGQRDSEAVPFYADGSFVVERGVIVTPKDITEQDG